MVTKMANLITISSPLNNRRNKGGCLKMRQLCFVLGGRRISGHGAEELFDGAFFNARLHVRLFKVKNSSKKSVFGKNRVSVWLFELKKSSIESSIGKPLWRSAFSRALNIAGRQCTTPRPTFRGWKVGQWVEHQMGADVPHDMQQKRRCLFETTPVIIYWIIRFIALMLIMSTLP